MNWCSDQLNITPIEKSPIDSSNNESGEQSSLLAAAVPVTTASKKVTQKRKITSKVIDIYSC